MSTFNTDNSNINKKLQDYSLAVSKLTTELDHT